MLLHDRVCGSQPQSRAFPHFFGGKERLEDAFLNLGVHAYPVVRKYHAKILSGARFGMGLHGLLVGNSLHRYFDPGVVTVCFFQCITRVQTEVKEGLLQLTFISLDGERMFGWAESNLDSSVKRLSTYADRIIQ